MRCPCRCPGSLSPESDEPLCLLTIREVAERWGTTRMGLGTESGGFLTLEGPLGPRVMAAKPPGLLFVGVHSRSSAAGRLRTDYVQAGHAPRRASCPASNAVSMAFARRMPSVCYITT
jgi:hypothetical protein